MAGNRARFVTDKVSTADDCLALHWLPQISIRAKNKRKQGNQQCVNITLRESDRNRAKTGRVSLPVAPNGSDPTLSPISLVRFPRKMIKLHLRQFPGRVLVAIMTSAHATVDRSRLFSPRTTACAASCHRPPTATRRGCAEGTGTFRQPPPQWRCMSDLKQQRTRPIADTIECTRSHWETPSST